MNIIELIQEHLLRIKRSLKWAKIMYTNHDFDHHYLLEMIRIKLEDMKECYIDTVIDIHGNVDKMETIISNLEKHSKNESDDIWNKIWDDLKKYGQGFWC